MHFHPYKLSSACVQACVGRSAAARSSWTNLSLSFAVGGGGRRTTSPWWRRGLLTDGRREASGSERRAVIRPGHLAEARRAPSSRRSLTRRQQLRTPRSGAPRTKVAGSISPLTGQRIKMDAQAATYPPIKGSVMLWQASTTHTPTQKHTSKQIDLSKLFYTNLLFRFSDDLRACFRREETSRKTSSDRPSATIRFY